MFQSSNQTISVGEIHRHSSPVLPVPGNARRCLRAARSAAASCDGEFMDGALKMGADFTSKPTDLQLI